MDFSTTSPADATCCEAKHSHICPADPLAQLRQGDPFDLGGRLYHPIAKGPNRIVLIGACECCGFPFVIDGLPSLLQQKKLPTRCPRHRVIERSTELSSAERDALAALLDDRKCLGKRWRSRHHSIPSIKQRPNRVSEGDFRVVGQHGYYVQVERMQERPRDGAVTRHFDIVAACATCKQMFSFTATSGHLNRRGNLPTRCPDHAHIRRAAQPVRWTPELLAAAKEFGR